DADRRRNRPRVLGARRPRPPTGAAPRTAPHQPAGTPAFRSERARYVPAYRCRSTAESRAVERRRPRRLAWGRPRRHPRGRSKRASYGPGHLDADRRRNRARLGAPPSSAAGVAASSPPFRLTLPVIAAHSRGAARYPSVRNLVRVVREPPVIRIFVVVRA